MAVYPGRAVSNHAFFNPRFDGRVGEAYGLGKALEGISSGEALSNDFKTKVDSLVKLSKKAQGLESLPTLDEINSDEVKYRTYEDFDSAFAQVLEAAVQDPMNGSRLEALNSVLWDATSNEAPEPNESAPRLPGG